MVAPLVVACGSNASRSNSDSSVADGGAAGIDRSEPAPGLTGSGDATTAPDLDAGHPPAVDGPSPQLSDGAVSSTDGATVASSAPVYGVTADDISNLSGLVDSLQSLPHRPTTRVVFDEGESPGYYAEAVPAIHAVSDVMGEILDSEYVASVSVAAYTTRTSQYLAEFSKTVDIWEVGNEINGNWLDTTSGGATDVAAKMTGAYDLVVAAGGQTALTLYGCSDSGASHDMMNWTTAHVPQRMLQGLDYVLVSYYEADCGSPRSDWAAVFQQLRQLYPKAKLGFGEVGAVNANGDDINDVSVSGPYLRRYYGMTIPEPGYIGGYFWWYYAEDMVPKTKPLFGILGSAIQ